MWTYKEVDGQALQLSVFLPEGYESSTERFPTFVVYHGGSWAVGEANWHYPDCEYWASRGMIAVSVDYRLKKRDGVKVPLECVKDAKSAVRFLRKNAARLKVDPDKMVIAGGSAGGQLAAAMATKIQRSQWRVLSRLMMTSTHTAARPSSMWARAANTAFVMVAIRTIRFFIGPWNCRISSL